MLFVMRTVKYIPKAQSLVPGASQYWLSCRTHSQIKNSVCVTSQSGNLTNWFLLPVATCVPQVYLVQTVPVSGDHLIGNLRKNEIAYLRAWINREIPVSMLKFWERVWVEKNLICLSAVPPPEARVEGLLGHHPIAFTAALWSWNFTNSVPAFWE